MTTPRATTPSRRRGRTPARAALAALGFPAAPADMGDAADASRDATGAGLLRAMAVAAFGAG